MCLKMKRERKHSDCGGRDIHEADELYLFDSWKTAQFFAHRLGWLIVEGVSNGELRAPQDINDEVYNLYQKAVG
jgi:hypothetical protein